MHDEGMGPLAWRVQQAALAVEAEFPAPYDSVRAQLFLGVARVVMTWAARRDRCGCTEPVLSVGEAQEIVELMRRESRGAIPDQDLRWLQRALEALAGYLATPAVREAG